MPPITYDGFVAKVEFIPTRTKDSKTRKNKGRGGNRRRNKNSNRRAKQDKPQHRKNGRPPLFYANHVLQLIHHKTGLVLNVGHWSLVSDYWLV